MAINVFEHHTISPLACYGLVADFWSINLGTVLVTWLALALGFLSLYGLRLWIQRNEEGKVAFAATWVTQALIDMNKDGLGYFDANIFGFTTALFFLTMFTNLIGLLPLIEEPTADPNTAIAIGLISFIYVQIRAIQHKGWHYIDKYFQPFFFFLPMNLIGQLAKIISLSFRLLGNILGGAIIWQLCMSLLEYIAPYYLAILATSIVILILHRQFPSFKVTMYLSPLATVFVCIVPGIQFFFGIFEGIVQAFVVCLLTNMYLSSELNTKEGAH